MRAAKARAIIERDVPAIVSVEQWEAAQQALQRNLRFSPRNTRRQYLLRGLMTCGLCGLTYTGAHWSRVDGSESLYYRCNGRTQGRGLYGKQAQLCPSPGVSGEIESLVWADIDGFLRNPGDVIEELVSLAQQKDDEAVDIRRQVAESEHALQDLSGQRDLVVGLYRRGRIDADALERQLDQIDADEVQVRTDLGSMEARAQAAGEKTARLRTAEDLLNDLHERLDEPITWERKRHLVELLVERICITPVTHEGKTAPVAEVTYTFTPITTRTGRDSSRQSSQKHHYRPFLPRNSRLSLRTGTSGILGGSTIRRAEKDHSGLRGTRAAARRGDSAAASRTDPKRKRPSLLKPRAITSKESRSR